MRKTTLAALGVGVALFVGSCSSATDDVTGPDTSGTATTIGRDTSGGTTTSLRSSSSGTSGSGTSGSGTSGSGTPATTVAGAVESALAAVADRDVTSFVAALRASGLAGDLGSREVTILAPDDGAFRALGANSVRALLADPARAKEVLLDHVVEGNWSAAELREKTSLTALSGRTLVVSATDGDLTIDGAEVVRPDAGGGPVVVHVINRVLLDR